MNKKQAYGKLLEVGARLVACRDLPSDYAEDYGQKTISIRRVARMMSKAHDAHKDMAYQIRQAADALMSEETK